MKTFSKISLALVAILFLLSFGMKNEAVAQCDVGYTPITVNMNIGGCVYQVGLCVKCSPLGLGATKVKIDHQVGITKVPTTPPCISSVPYASIVDYVMAQVQTPAFLFNILCPNTPDAPPCDGPNDPITVTLYSPLCWQAEVISYFGNNELFFSPCSDDECVETFTICVDANGAYQKTPVSKNGPSSLTCTEEAYKIEFPASFEELQTWTPGYKTECYIYHSVCNP